VYLHAIWHLLSFVSSYQACVLGAYFFVRHERTSLSCEVAYWPSDAVKVLALPYIEMRKKSKRKN
jgi:hypothetical protein